ncbi:MAG TPA: zinc metallopeptidase [bacterium]
MFWFWDPTMIIVLPAILLALYAQLRVQSTYARYSRVPVSTGLTGAAAAQEILRRNGLANVQIERIDGMLSDHYDPRTRTLSLSSDVYGGASVAAVGVAAHETGHAIQHAREYAPLALRSAMVPTVQFGSWLAWPIFLLGYLFHSGTMLQLGILIFSAAVVFTVVTLPVEFDASARALRALREEGLVTPDELRGVRSVLTAAALTYVAAAATAILELVRMLLLANRREE